MNRRWTLATIAVAIALVTVGGAVLATAGDHELSSTALTDYFPAGVAEAKPASFKPAISKDRAISTVRNMLRDHFGVTTPETLPTSAILATFSGQAHDGRGTVDNVPVWVVVVKDLPFSASGGPRGAGEVPSRTGKGKPQFAVAIDASTGVAVHSVVSGKVIPAEEAAK